jgi:ribulose 1,5-bisphosphate synthetase/thiazole synthase
MEPFHLTLSVTIMPIISVDEFTSKTFDYIIVGGGTAGLVVAARSVY